MNCQIQVVFIENWKEDLPKYSWWYVTYCFDQPVSRKIENRKCSEVLKKDAKELIVKSDFCHLWHI